MAAAGAEAAHPPDLWGSEHVKERDKRLKATKWKPPSPLYLN